MQQGRRIASIKLAVLLSIRNRLNLRSMYKINAAGQKNRFYKISSFVVYLPTPVGAVYGQELDESLRPEV